MRRTRLALWLLGLIIAAATLTGCSTSSNAGYSDEGFSVQVVQTPTGAVTCVVYDGYDGDSISCDWANAR